MNLAGFFNRQLLAGRVFLQANGAFASLFYPYRHKMPGKYTSTPAIKTSYLPAIWFIEQSSNLNKATTPSNHGTLSA
ncbi:hypothetical protein NP590_15380 [Methylomonas sp. SURF-2]|uniref:Uncharacterized protein n=1 Tax=Methylomonas subterranea TaxID=2952225 RepID=A0ABT1TJ47_9GAMM|nr:hypothetical protein [Methylomonas sp. SURF-2]MCQ8105493.1 hypothetical protein [Methylomonas sp. SURF-2]